MSRVINDDACFCGMFNNIGRKRAKIREFEKYRALSERRENSIWASYYIIFTAIKKHWKAVLYFMKLRMRAMSISMNDETREDRIDRIFLFRFIEWTKTRNNKGLFNVLCITIAQPVVRAWRGVS